jgi:hypothetical protein
VNARSAQIVARNQAVSNALIAARDQTGPIARNAAGETPGRSVANAAPVHHSSHGQTQRPADIHKTQQQ